MKHVKLGSLCKTKKDKKFLYNDVLVTIKKDTCVTVCDIDNINEDYVLVEIEGFDTVF